MVDPRGFRILRLCFCDIAPDRLALLARQRYVDGRSTLELLHAGQTIREKEEAGMVGLLCVADHAFQELLEEHPELLEHVLRCRRSTVARLAEAGVRVAVLGEGSGEPGPAAGRCTYAGDFGVR